MMTFVAVRELGHQRCDLAIDFAADRSIANVGMHGIGEVDGIGPPRQRDELALGREAKHLVVEQFELGVLQELFRIGSLG